MEFLSLQDKQMGVYYEAKLGFDNLETQNGLDAHSVEISLGDIDHFNP